MARVACGFLIANIKRVNLIVGTFPGFFTGTFRAQDSPMQKIRNMKIWIYFYRDLNHGHINYIRNGREKQLYKKLKCLEKRML